MRTKVTLILLFLNVALFFFIFKFERGWRTEQASLEARRRVLGAETANIQHLRISGPGIATVQLDRKNDKWALTEPIQWPANPHAVSRIINELQFLEHETSFSVEDLEKNNQTLADYGLDQPSLTVSFTSGTTTPSGTPDETEVSLYVGNETKVGNRLYVLSSDRTRVHVVNISLAHSLTIPIENLRADTVFSIPVFEARSLNLQNAANLRVRVRRDGNNWSFEAPIIARASKPSVELSINALNALRVRRFVSQDTSEHNPRNSPTLRITLEGNNRRETLLLGEKIGPTAIPGSTGETKTENTATSPDIEYYAMLEGKTTLFTLSLPSALIDALLNAQVALRETRILDFNPDNVTSLSLAAPNQPELTLQRLETTSRSDTPRADIWQIVRRAGNQGPQTQPADSQSILELLNKLSALSAQKFVSDAPSDADLETWGFNRPEREITLTHGSGNTSETTVLQIGIDRQNNGHAYARLANARYVYLVDSGVLETTKTSPLKYREHLLRELPEAATIDRIVITDLEDKQIVFEAEVKATNDETLKTLIGQLRTLRAKDFIRDSFADQIEVTGELRPWRYRLDAIISLPSSTADQTATSSLYLSPRLGGSRQLAGSVEFDAVFTVNQPLLDTLWALIYPDPGPPPPQNSEDIPDATEE